MDYRERREELRARRKQMGVTAKVLGYVAHCSGESVRRFECGESTPRTYLLVALFKALDDIAAIRDFYAEKNIPIDLSDGKWLRSQARRLTHGPARMMRETPSPPARDTAAV